jgi:hypothetical protein
MATKGMHVNVYRLPDGTWRCDLKLNTSASGQGVTVRGTSEDEPGNVMGAWWDRLSRAGRALAKTRTIAQAILANPAVAAAFPQYVAPALAALKAIEVAEKKGLLPKLKKQFQDPTLKKLAKEMDEMSKGQRNAMSGGGVCLSDGREPRSSMMGDDFPSGRLKPAPFGLSSFKTGPFGLPVGNPHPFAESIRRQVAQGTKDPLEVQKLARMFDYQRRMARAAR